MTYYFKQIDRVTGDVLGYVSYNNYYPNNNNPDILLEELTEEEYTNITNSFIISNESEEE